MSRLSQHQNVFRVVKPGSLSNDVQPRANTRNRQSVSCLACKTRKLKCDRQVPCLSCSKRGDAGLCLYSNGTQIERKNHGSGPGVSSEAQLRLQRLEDMVTCLMRTSEKSGQSLDNVISLNKAPSIDQSDRGLSVTSRQSLEASPGGHLDMNGLETTYIGGTHWASILENIRDIQGVLNAGEDENEQTIPVSLTDDADLIIDSLSSLTLSEVCSTLPARAVADKLLSLYFNSKHTQIAIVHSGKFQREYDSFWANPSSVSFLWISILFSALHIGSQIDQNDSNEVSATDRARSMAYFIKAGQCLVTGGYRKARPYSVEAVLLYAICKYMRKADPDADAWMMMGIAARLAMRMGYHRDPRHLANISPFEGEMRRRTFYVVEIFDLLFSFQAGLPAILHEEECDTDLPSNLLDSDFDESCEVLPPSRPVTDPTPVLYYCYKCRLAQVFRRVIRHALSLNGSSYEETMRLDGELRQIQTEVPPSLRMKPLSSSFTDQPYVILNRLNIDILYQKSLCVLHRNYLSHDQSNEIFAYSRRTCTNAALQILKYQSEIHIACLPGGQLCNEKWMASSLILHDFLLAAMIISLDLYESYNKPTSESPDDLVAKDEKYQALKLSYEMLSSRRAFSRDARRGSNVLAVMLSKVQRSDNEPSRIYPSPDTSNIAHGLLGKGNVIHRAGNSPESSLQNTANTNVLSQEFLLDHPASPDFTFADPLGNVFAEIDNIDWGLIDQGLLGFGDAGNAQLDWQLPGM